MKLSLTRKLVIMCIITSLLMWSGCSYAKNTSANSNKNKNYDNEMYEQSLQKQPPEISDIQFQTTEGKIIMKKGNWVELKNRVKIHITLNGPATEVELYMVPTGTGTYKLQQLIDTIIPQSGVAEYTWDVPESTMGHFWIVAYNGDVGRKSQTINIIRQDK